MDMIRQFTQFFQPYYKLCILLATILFLASGLTVLSPFLYRELVDKGIHHHHAQTVIVMVILIALSLVLQESLSVWQTAITLRMREGVFSALKQKLYRQMMGLSHSYFATQHKGRLLSLISSDVHVLQNLFLDRLVLFFRNVIVGILIFIILLVIQMKLVLIALIFMPLLYVLYFMFRTKISILSRLNQEQQESLTERLQEDFSAVTAIQAFSVVKERMRETAGYMLRSEAARRKLDMQYAIASSSTIVINLIGIIVIWGIGASEVMNHRMTMGTLIAISFFFNYIITLFYSAYYTVMQLQGAIPSAKRILDMLNTKQTILNRSTAVEGDFSGSVIAMNDVTFAYTPTQPVLTQVNIEIQRGEVVGIIGDSGQGKTTLANLLQRFADPQDGQVTLAGVDIRDIKLETLRRTVVTIPQEDLLMNESIRSNIIMYRSGITEDQFERACEEAQLYDFAEQLPDGFDTVVGERGIKLSGGQRKRISIARALLENPYILILDEATSMLDEETETAILKMIVSQSREKIVLMITHKTLNLRFATRVLRIRDGMIVREASYALAETRVYHDNSN